VRNKLRQGSLAGQISPTQRYLSARDLAFFCLDFSAGDRASDLRRIFTKENMALPDCDGFLFHHTFGKTFWGKYTNTFMVKKCRDLLFCPVANLGLYVDLCDLMSIDLRDGYLFRSTDKKGAVSNKPFIGSETANRLSLHLATLRMHNGETIFTVKISTDLACAQRRYPNTSGLRRQCSLSLQELIFLFMQTFSGFRSLSPSYTVLVQCEIFCPSHLPFGDACILPLSLSYDPLPLQNLASHNLVSRRQSVVVLTLKMVYDFFQPSSFQLLKLENLLR